MLRTSVKTLEDSDKNEETDVYDYFVPYKNLVEVLDGSHSLTLMTISRKVVKHDLYTSVVLNVENLDDGGVDITVDGGRQGNYAGAAFGTMTIESIFTGLLAESDKPEEMVKQFDSTELDPEADTILMKF